MKLSVNMSACNESNVTALTDEVRTTAGACILALWTSFGGTGLRGSISNIITHPVVASTLENKDLSQVFLITLKPSTHLEYMEKSQPMSNFMSERTAKVEVLARAASNGRVPNHNPIVHRLAIVLGWNRCNSKRPRRRVESATPYQSGCRPSKRTGKPTSDCKR